MPGPVPLALEQGQYLCTKHMLLLFDALDQGHDDSTTSVGFESSMGLLWCSPSCSGGGDRVEAAVGLVRSGQQRHLPSYSVSNHVSNVAAIW